MTPQDTDQGPDTSAPQPQLSLLAPETRPHEGKVEAEKFGYASELLAYRVMNYLADIVAQRVSVKLKEGEHRVLLVSDPEYALGDLPLVEIRGQISQLRSAFTQREEDNKALLDFQAEPPESIPREAAGWSAASTILAAATLLGQAPRVVGTLADVAAYFRSNYKITGRDFEVVEQALFSSVAGALAGNHIKVFISGFCTTEESEILRDLTDLVMCAVRLKIQRNALASQLPESENEGESNQPLQSQNQLATKAAAVRETDAVLLSFEAFRATWTTPSESQQVSKLEEALVRERIEKLNITHLLWLRNLSSGGEATVRDRLVREDRVGFMGGTVVSFVLEPVW